MQQTEFKRGRACSIKTISLYYFLDLKMEFALSMSLPIFFCIYVSGSTAGALFLLMHLESKHDATALVLPQTIQFVQGWEYHVGKNPSAELSESNQMSDKRVQSLSAAPKISYMCVSLF